MVAGELGQIIPLNESPSEKEGKSARCGSLACNINPSMKVPPKRKGNVRLHDAPHLNLIPQ